MAEPKTQSDEGESRRERSPNYPNIGFKTALELVRKIYEADKRFPLNKELAVKHMGYSGFSGRSRMVLSALRKYGLLEAVGDQVKVSDDAHAIMIMPPDDPKRANLVRRLAMRPQIFQELVAEYAGELPSDANLKTNLVLNKKFTESAAETIIAALKESMAEGGTLGPASTVQDESADKKPESQEFFAGMFSPSDLGKLPSSEQRNQMPSVDVQVVNLGDGVKAELRILGNAESKHLRKLIKFIELSLDEDETG